jgi:hypothetical protein
MDEEAFFQTFENRYSIIFILIYIVMDDTLIILNQLSTRDFYLIQRKVHSKGINLTFPVNS